MALVIQEFTLDITPGGIPPVLHVTEYDENMQVVVHLLQRWQAFTIPSGTTAKVEGTLDGHPFSADATVDGSNVTFELTKGMTAYAGRAWTKIKLTQNSKPVSTCGFWLECDRAGVEAGTIIGAPGFEEQIADAAAEWMEQQGFTSPTVAVTPITGGNRVTFTDKDGTETMDVMNGKDGESGQALISDGAVTDAKLSDDLYKQVMGDERHKLTEVEVTPIPHDQAGEYWVPANFDGSVYKVVTTFFTPLAKTPRYIKVVNKTSATTIKLEIGYTKYRFANGADESAEGFAIGNAARNLQFFNKIQIAPGDTLLYDLQEFGRKGCEYFQFIIKPAVIAGRYTDSQFSAKLREQAEVYYVYDSYIPAYSLPDDSGEFLIDLPVRYAAQGINNTSTTIGYAVVPYYPDTTYNVRGGHYANTAVNTLQVLFLLDDAIFNGRDKGINFNSGDCGHVPLIIGGSTTQYDTSVNGGANSKYQWAYFKTPPASELVGPKYVAFPMMTVSQDDATDKGEEYYKAIFDALNEQGPKNTYITRFNKQIPRSLYAQLVFPNPNYHDDGSKYYAMLTSASKSPLVGASWVLFGDSLTDNYGGHDLTGNFFATKIAREFNMSFDNRAKSGSNIYRGGSGNYTSVSGMIKLDEFTAEIDAGTTEQPDYITIAFGTNSFTAQIGTNADTSETDTTVYGATKRFIEVLREKCPKSVFGFVLSPKQNWGSSDPQNIRAVDAARAAIKTVCDEYGVPYIDMSTQSGITAAMLPDGIHISNDQSQNLYYHAMRRFMIGL